jgi:predicted DNA-binding transcriptional regulator AlpA
MSIAAIRNEALSGKQLANHNANNLSLVEAPAQPQAKFGVQRVENDLYALNEATVQQSRPDERLLNARQVADKLGVSERWVRDHTTRRSPRIHGIRLGLLVRYRREDVDVFMGELDTFPSVRAGAKIDHVTPR